MKINSENILKDFSTYINYIGKANKSKLISFAFPLEQTDIMSVVDLLNSFSRDTFFFRTPNNKVTLIGLNAAVELLTASDIKFILASENYNYWKNNILSNWNNLSQDKYPIICCAAKLDSHKVSNLWADFVPLRIFVPEFLLYSNKNKIICCFNFIPGNQKSLEQSSDRFSFYLEKLEYLLNNQTDNFDSKIYLSRISAENEINDWNIIFSEAIKVLNKGDLAKLVLSRTKRFSLNESINWNNLLSSLYNRFPDCYLFFVRQRDSFFFGSSPEMFLKVKDNYAEVESVAGSAPRGERSDMDYQLEKVLQTSEKNHQEHLLVSNFISDILIQYSDNVRIIEEKQIRKLENIQHLITKISAELNFKNNLFELIDSLFPTPAVCGVPKESAMNFIRKLETHDRGLYSGLIGIMDFDGNCELAVSIRSALVKENKITAFAGAGILRNSNMDEEFLETNLKLNTILSLFSYED